MVLLLGYNLDISLDFFNILIIISYIIILKIFNINNKFGFNNIDYYLLLINNI